MHANKQLDPSVIWILN